jgi:hypothetical protein
LTVRTELTASRNITLPVIAAKGDFCGVYWPTGHASNAAVILTGAGNTCAIGGSSISASSEITRLFVPGEWIEFYAYTSTAWMVVHDGRIPMKAQIRLTTNVGSSETANTFVFPTDITASVWTAETDVGGICTASTGTITVRRACKASLSVSGRPNTALSVTKYFNVMLDKNAGTSIIAPPAYHSGAATNPHATQSIQNYALATGDTIRFKFRSEEGSKGLAASAYQTQFSMTEEL